VIDVPCSASRAALSRPRGVLRVQSFRVTQEDLEKVEVRSVKVGKIRRRIA
jgi:hypothetical protein